MEEIIKEQIVEKIVNKYNFNNRYKDDIIQDLYLLILEVDPDKVEKLKEKNQWLKYVSGLCYRALSNTGKISKKYNFLKKECLTDILEKNESQDF